MTLLSHFLAFLPFIVYSFIKGLYIYYIPFFNPPDPKLLSYDDINLDMVDIASSLREETWSNSCFSVETSLNEVSNGSGYGVLSTGSSMDMVRNCGCLGVFDLGFL